MQKLSKKKINGFLIKVIFLIIGTLFLINIIPHVAKSISDGATSHLNKHNSKIPLQKSLLISAY